MAHACSPVPGLASPSDDVCAAGLSDPTGATTVGTPPTPALQHARSFIDVEAILHPAAEKTTAVAFSTPLSPPRQLPLSAQLKQSRAHAATAAAASPSPPALLCRTPPQPRTACTTLRPTSRSHPSGSRSGVTSVTSVTRSVQVHEDDEAWVAIVCEPEASSLSMGGLHPRASLFERPVNTERAKTQHAGFRKVLRDHGVRVLTVREILSHGVDRHTVRARVELEDLAAATLTYQMAEGTNLNDLAEADHHFLSDAYKRQVIEHMSVDQLIDVVLTNPTVHLAPSNRDTGLTASYTFEPLSNLVYTRDQQITTARGVVMGRLRSQQRQWEVELMKFCLGKLGMPVIGEIMAPGFLEGGDFFPLGFDLALVGVGLRSNFDACRQLMEEDLLGTRRLVVVRDDFDMHQDRMHLDSIFSPIGPKTCLLLADAIGRESPRRRVVDEYVRGGGTVRGEINSKQSTRSAAAADSGTMAGTVTATAGPYRLNRSGVDLSEYLAEEGFAIIPISSEHQREYACNVLNLGSSRIITAHAPSARVIASHPAFNGDVHVIDFSSVTSMYGACHCAAQVLRRETRRSSAAGQTSAGIDPLRRQQQAVTTMPLPAVTSSS